VAGLREFASCLGLPANFSIVRDVFGYASAPPWKTAAGQPSLPQVLSLATQMRRLRLKQFALNAIRVGTNAAGLMSPADEQSLDCAIQITRDIYAAAGIGIARVERWWHIPLSDNTGFEVIDSDDEAEELIDSYTVPHGGVDVFVVPFYTGDVRGIAPVKSDGIVVELTGEYLRTGRTMAHELGHFFGLRSHENDDDTNLMCQTDKALELPLGAHLNPDQVEKILKHPSIGAPCPGV
jgi:hypothetical protein